MMLCLALVLGLAQVSAWAGPVSPGVWYEFYWDDGTTGPSSNVSTSGCTDTDAYCPLSPPYDVTLTDDPAWTYTAGSSGALFTITDVASAGDSFNVYDNASLILATPTVSSDGYVCGTTDTDYVDPAVCVSDPNMSNGQAFLAPGLNSITIVARDAPFGDGVGDFFIQPLPEPALGPLGGAMIVGLACLKRYLAPKQSS
jgi:hypothetical protein